MCVVLAAAQLAIMWSCPVRLRLNGRWYETKSGDVWRVKIGGTCGTDGRPSASDQCREVSQVWGFFKDFFGYLGVFFCCFFRDDRDGLDGLLCTTPIRPTPHSRNSHGISKTDSWAWTFCFPCVQFDHETRDLWCLVRDGHDPNEDPVRGRHLGGATSMCFGLRGCASSRPTLSASSVLFARTAALLCQMSSVLDASNFKSSTVHSILTLFSQQNCSTGTSQKPSPGKHIQNMPKRCNESTSR